jgi:hypothetical protein
MSNVTESQQYGASNKLLDYVFRQQVSAAKPMTVVDFGAGAGKNGKLLREVLGKGVRLIAIEGCPGTAEMLRGQGVYDEVHCELLQSWICGITERYDLATFGDVLEHLTPRDIHRVIRRAQRNFSEIIVTVPLGDILQGEVYGNPLEVHRTFITGKFFDRYKPVEKHIAIGTNWTIMNVRIAHHQRIFALRHRAARSLVRTSLRALQALGLGGLLAGVLRKRFARYHWMLRNLYSE